MIDRSNSVQSAHEKPGPASVSCARPGGYRRYRSAWNDAHGFFALNLVASRGCPYKCNWCAKPIYGNSFNVRSSECVATEMLELRDRFGADYLWFADDLFGIRQDWVQELADHVERKKAIVPFKMQSRVDLMQEDTVRRFSARVARRSGWVSNRDPKRF